MPGLAEKLEQELAAIVPNSIHTQVHILYCHIAVQLVLSRIDPFVSGAHFAVEVQRCLLGSSNSRFCIHIQ